MKTKQSIFEINGRNTDIYVFLSSIFMVRQYADTEIFQSANGNDQWTERFSHKKFLWPLVMTAILCLHFATQIFKFRSAWYKYRISNSIIYPKCPEIMVQRPEFWPGRNTWPESGLQFVCISYSDHLDSLTWVLLILLKYNYWLLWRIDQAKALLWKKGLNSFLDLYFCTFIQN